VFVGNIPDCGSEFQTWIVMEYCDVGSVRNLIDVTGEYLSEQLIRIVLKQVLRGLVYLHSKGIMHGSTKAANILMDHYGHCKIAPELFASHERDHKADIWSLGIAAIEMATGRPPYFDDNPLQVIYKIGTRDPPKLPEDEDHYWSAHFRHFIDSCLVKNPKERPSAQALSQHPWIRDADDIRVLSKWVRNKLPLLEEHRREINEAFMADNFKHRDFKAE